MFFVIFFITLLFIGIGFSSLYDKVAFLHPLSTFFFTLFSAITANIFLSFLGIVLLIGCMYFLLHKSKKTPFWVKLTMSAAHGTMLVILGFFLSFGSLYILAVVHTSVYALFVQFSPATLGILVDRDAVLEHLQNEDAPPRIVATDGSSQKLIQAISIASSGDDNFYGAYVLSAVPQVVPIFRKTDLVMIDNTLILSGISGNTLQTISPLIGYAYLKRYFWNRNIKAYPQVSLMDLTEYKGYREKDAYEKLQKVEKNLGIIESAIASASAGIEEKKQLIAVSKDIITNGKTSRDTEYKNCLQEKKKVALCREIIETWDINMKQAATDFQTASQEELDLKETLAAYGIYKTIFASQKSVLQTLKSNIPHELGVFVPPQTVKIVYDTTHKPSIPDYLSILTHEYLHYASFVSEEKRFSDAFFEEALTEYFARNIISQEVGKETNIGYPIQVKIITEMTKLIPEGEFEDIYFSKDEQALEKALDRVYGDDFYLTNRVLFDSLQYSSDPTQTLKIANDIMKKIGGPRLTTKDLQSNFMQ